MTLVNYNHRHTGKLDSIFNDFFGFPAHRPGQAFTGSPAVNIQENNHAFAIELNVPGRSKEDFKVNVENDLLTISYEKKDEEVVEGTKSIRREFSFNSFRKTFTLDEKVDTGNIQASYINGILKIELPKKEEVKSEPKQIAIN